MFLKEILSLFHELLLSFLKFWISIFEDLKSFRNKLILISTLLCIYTINKGQSNEVIITSLGIWNMIIAYYFKKRNESKEMEIKSFTEIELENKNQ